MKAINNTAGIILIAIIIFSVFILVARCNEVFIRPTIDLIKTQVNTGTTSKSTKATKINNAIEKTLLYGIVDLKENTAAATIKVTHVESFINCIAVGFA